MEREVANCGVIRRILVDVLGQAIACRAKSNDNVIMQRILGCILCFDRRGKQGAVDIAALFKIAKHFGEDRYMIKWLIPILAQQGVLGGVVEGVEVGEGFCGALLVILNL